MLQFHGKWTYEHVDRYYATEFGVVLINVYQQIITSFLWLEAMKIIKIAPTMVIYVLERQGIIVLIKKSKKH